MPGSFRDSPAPRSAVFLLFMNGRDARSPSDGFPRFWHPRISRFASARWWVFSAPTVVKDQPYCLKRHELYQNRRAEIKWNGLLKHFGDPANTMRLSPLTHTSPLRLLMPPSASQASIHASQSPAPPTPAPVRPATGTGIPPVVPMGGGVLSLRRLHILPKLSKMSPFQGPLSGLSPHRLQ